MKTTLALITLLISLSSFAIEVDVISAEIGVEDEAGRPELCLTVVRVPSNAKLVGIVETKFDCFYTRQAKKNSRIDVNHKQLLKVEPSLLRHLQSREPNLEFVYSDGE
ncbi:MAG: hypothetical protein ACJ76H_04400 [Bacteriovoracaceae bacterium]